ncbi:hypothetical protein B0H34DRAFT_67830 [Crassisporium funariophilum]|nr:hypothetical protein B0H34DRAFT_67830 [Crassisporium funariophilum]
MKKIAGKSEMLTRMSPIEDSIAKFGWCIQFVSSLSQRCRSTGPRSASVVPFADRNFSLHSELLQTIVLKNFVASEGMGKFVLPYRNLIFRA